MRCVLLEDHEVPVPLDTVREMIEALRDCEIFLNAPVTKYGWQERRLIAQTLTAIKSYHEGRLRFKEKHHG